MKPLYLLAFILTANHEEAERCFMAAADQALKETSVFKEWARSWIKRTVIKNAIQSVFPESTEGNQKRDLWKEVQNESTAEGVINAMTQLEPSERFVFVMAILERYSTRECSVLLSCTVERVLRARTRALSGLPTPDPRFTSEEEQASRFLEASA
jgi:DNA-directed RNA polymerase specialized sigma24 family protein